MMATTTTGASEKDQAAGAGSTSTTARAGGGADPTAADLGACRIVRFYRSAVGKKWVMAVTGIILMGFVLGAHDREPEAVPLQGGDQPLRRGAAQHARARCCRAPCCSGRADRSDRRVRVPHPRRARAHADQPARAAAADRYQSKRDYVAADYASRTMRWTGIISPRRS
jgi:succinate dehydrogenase / fumarate reductase cytochrome b subunit